MSNIKHIESNIKIYFTRDHSIFKTINGNRTLNEAKIKRINNDINNGLNMLRYCPIIVDPEMNVIDGQHRLAVAKQLKQNVWYVILDDEVTLHGIARMNSNTERWKTEDFVNCYLVQGNENYKTLSEFAEQYNFSIGICCYLLMFVKTSESGLNKKAKEAFERGDFVVNHEDYAHEVANLVLQFTEHKGHTKRGFIDAIATLLKNGKCDFKHLVKKFNSDPELLEECTTAKDYLRAIEVVYNKGSQIRKVIY